jgi:hypothetical protein
MKTKLELRDRTHAKDTITGYSKHNMIMRMFGKSAYGINAKIDEPCTVCAGRGRVIGTAIFHEN